MLDPPMRLVRSVRPAAFVAAVFVMTAAFAVDAIHVAAAQGRLDAEYAASLAGIPIGRGNWIIEISEDQFTATASGGTIGILRFFTPGHGTGAAQGAHGLFRQPALFFCDPGDPQPAGDHHQQPRDRARGKVGPQ